MTRFLILSRICRHYSHADYAVFSYGLFGHWSELKLTVPNKDVLQPLEDIIYQFFVFAYIF